MTSIAAIVCGHTLDRWDDIQLAIASLQAQTRPPDELFLAVDNNQELFDAATRSFAGVATVVHNTGNRGVSPTRNAAAKAAASDVLAYLDDDAQADPRWIDQLIGWYDDPSVVGVGGTANPAWDGGRAPAWFPASFNWVVGCSHSGIGDRPAPVRNFIGCNMSIRRTAWEAVGGFYDGLGRIGADGGGGDETDFCIRVTERCGGVIMNDPAAMVSHRVPTARQTVGYFVKRCRSEGRSKAQIEVRAGADRALAAERKHLLGELPRSFLAGLGDAARGDFSGLRRAAAIALGTAATGAGYLRERVRRVDPVAAYAESDYVGADVVVVDLDQDDPVPSTNDRRLFVVCRRGTQVLGTAWREAPLAGSARLAELRRSFPARAARPGGRSAEPALDPTATVVIATKDRTASLRRTLQSVFEMTRQPDQLIVVDNAPRDEQTRDMIEGLNKTLDRPIVYLCCATPGLANAHNASLAHASSQVIAFTDDDVLVDRLWLEMLLDGFDQSSTVVAVTGAIMPAEIETWPQEWVEVTSNYTKGFSPHLFGRHHRSDPLFPFTAGSMGSGANMAFSTSWLREHGGFHAALGAGTTALGGDDLRAFYDVIASGHDLFFTPDAMVFHHHHRTAEAIDRQCHGYGAGLGAFLTSVMVDDPKTLVSMVRQAPRALRHAMAVTGASGDVNFPGDARRTRKHRRGLLGGPARFLRSRRAH